MQKEVAEQIGISRGHYIDYEVGYVDYYPKEVVDRLADFYHIPVEDLLDEYNLFLYKGQGKMLKECWEKYFREVLLANQNASNQNNI